MKLNKHSLSTNQFLGQGQGEDIQEMMETLKLYDQQFINRFNQIDLEESQNGLKQ